MITMIRKTTKTNERRCGNCLWHEHEDIDDGYVCVNRDSQHVADWTEDDSCCDHWEEKTK